MSQESIEIREYKIKVVGYCKILLVVTLSLGLFLAAKESKQKQSVTENSSHDIVYVHLKQKTDKK